ncbi:MAG: formylglycine-generating enzyme family protein [Candidatus Adiutrix sp.]|jgi:formylglycine-generating enzyme required for sulfatase activity|nr:formylglycine-generating enzyme family protein [Candidatus Adiutrix sp.]
MFRRLASFSVKQTIGFLLFSLLAGVVLCGPVQAQEKTFTNSIGMDFVLIPSGQFSRGVVTAAEAVKNDFGEVVQPAKDVERLVTISRPFYLGKYEVTQEQWVAVMGEGSNPSKNTGRTNPVEMVSWDDAQKFIQKLNEKEGGKKYRLPTEAEWEHAARAGTKTKWFFGDKEKALGKYAWFGGNHAPGGNSGRDAHPVGQKKPNPWGLYDIYGNVCEWVQDWYDEYPEEAVTDPTGPSGGSNRVFRGGSRYGTGDFCRSAIRFRFTPDYRYVSLGFRLAFSPGQ